MSDIYTRVTRPHITPITHITTEDTFWITTEDGFDLILEESEIFPDYTRVSKPINATYVKVSYPVEPIKKQDGGYLLLQGGGKILLNQKSISDYININKPIT